MAELNIYIGGSWLSICDNDIRVYKSGSWLPLIAGTDIYLSGSWETITCPLPPTATGIFVVDFFADTTLDVIGYVDTSGTTPYHDICYTGVNFIPNDGVTPAASCWVLGSDQNPPNPTRRFEFNVAKLITAYPAMTNFTFKVQGRSVSGGAVNGSYVLKGADQGNMTMTGSPGSYIPSVVTATSIGIVPFTTHFPSGADGTYGLGIGTVVFTGVYDVVLQTMTVTVI